MALVLPCLAVITLAVVPGCGSGSMVTVPAGLFRMGCSGSDSSCAGDEKPVHEVFLDAFSIDKTEVTVDAYAACVSAGKCSNPTTGVYCNWEVSGRGDHPINCVDWSQAVAYCAWAGGRLPTEAEWERAARGTDGRVYPWGNEKATCQRAVMYDGGDGCGKDRTFPVGSKPRGASPSGALDMAGNVWEWVSDRYDSNYYKSSPSRNPRGPSSGSFRVKRGGSFDYVASLVRAGYRSYDAPSRRGGYLGFRCAR